MNDTYEDELEEEQLANIVEDRLEARLRQLGLLTSENEQLLKPRPTLGGWKNELSQAGGGPIFMR